MGELANNTGHRRRTSVGRSRLATGVLGVAAACAIGGRPAGAGTAAPPVIVPMCWAVPDNAPTIYMFGIDEVNPLPPEARPLTRQYLGEGAAYRAATRSVALFSSPPIGTVGEFSMWYWNVRTGVETKAGTIPWHVDAAAFFTDPADLSEQLWVVNNADLYRLDPATAAVLDGPFTLPGIGGSSGGLDFDPLTGEMWMTDDAPEAVLYRIDHRARPVTAQPMATLGFADGSQPDAEGIGFGAQGLMYTEGKVAAGSGVGTRMIGSVDRATGVVTPVAGPFPGRDIEGLACNSGAALFPDAFPAVQIEKAVNLEDADAAPGPSVKVGTVVSFRYRVKNTGNVPLHDLVVADDRVGTVVCPSGSAKIAALAVGELVDCSATDLAVEGAYANTGSVSAWAEIGDPVATVQITDTDLANYQGITPTTTVATSAPTTVATTVDSTTATTAPVTDPGTSRVLFDGDLPETGREANRTIAAIAAVLVLVGVMLRQSSRRRRVG